MSLNNVTLRWGTWFGDEPLHLTFPKNWEVNVVEPPDLPTLDVEAVRRRLAQPIGTPRLAELALQRERAVILVDDLTRPTPVARLIPVVLEELVAGGIERDAVTVVVAGGTHTRMTAADVARKLGEPLSRELRILVHDSKKDLEYLGRSERGTPLYVDRHVMACDLKIGLGGIYPHRTAGFSGGPKIVMPGVVGLKTARHLHKHNPGAGQRGGSIDSEFRREVADLADRVGLNFLVNVTLNAHRQVTALFAGHRLAAFEEGVKFARELYRIPPLADADIVIADSYPFDITMHVALARRVFWPALAATARTTRVGIAACPLGIGTHEIFSHQRGPLRRTAREARKIARSLLTGSGRRQARKEDNSPLLLLAPGLRPKQVSRVQQRFRHFASWEALLDQLVTRHRDMPARVALYRCAGLLLEPRSDPGGDNCN